MKYIKLIVSTLIVGTLLIAPNFAGAQTSPTAKQKSQIEYLMTYSHEKDGKHPTFNQAYAVVKLYPKVWTMAEAKKLHFFAIKIKSVHASDSPNQGNLQFTMNFSYVQRLGIANIAYFGFTMQLGWHYDRGANSVTDYWVKGYPFVTKIGSPLSHYVGEYTGTGYPYWQAGGGGSEVTGGIKYMLSTWEAYYVIQEFAWGYGPLSIEKYLRIFMAGYANGRLGVWGYF